MSASASNVVPSQFDAAQVHPEFGYFAPTMGFRRKVALTLKAAVGGVLVGAVAVFFVVIDREEQALTMLATPVLATPISAPPAPSTPPNQAAAIDIFAPVPFVPESLALPAAASRTPRRGGVASPTVAAVAPGPMKPTAPVVATPPVAPVAVAVSAPAPTSAPDEVKAAAKPKKKAVRAPQPDRIARSAPPEPRAAFASPFRLLGLPIFGFGR